MSSGTSPDELWSHLAFFRGGSASPSNTAPGNDGLKGLGRDILPGEDATGDSLDGEQWGGGSEGAVLFLVPAHGSGGGSCLETRLDAANELVAGEGWLGLAVRLQCGSSRLRLASKSGLEEVCNVPEGFWWFWEEGGSAGLPVSASVVVLVIAGGLRILMFCSICLAL